MTEMFKLIALAFLAGFIFVFAPFVALAMLVIVMLMRRK